MKVCQLNYRCMLNIRLCAHDSDNPATLTAPLNDKTG